MTFKPDHWIGFAEALSDKLAALTAPIEATAWEIDTALSTVRKNGYDTTTRGELQKAVIRGKQLLSALSAVRDLEKTRALRDLADASRDVREWVAANAEPTLR